LKEKLYLKICIITSWYPSKKSPILGPFVEHFAKSLANYGLNVQVITTLEDGDTNLEKKDSLIVHRIKGKTPFIPIGIFSYVDISSLIAILKIIKKIQPDIIHVQAPNYFSLSAIILLKLLRKRIVGTIHRAEVADKVSRSIFVLRKLALRMFDELICVSNYTKCLAMDAGAIKEKTSVIYNSCDESYFYLKNKFEVRRLLDLPSDKKIILFVGNLIQRKGTDTLIHSLNDVNERYSNFIAIIVGKGIESQKLESLVNEYHLTDMVKFLGGISKTELSNYYSAADVFVLPSVSEGHSVAVLEAMASGLPIVASDIQGNKESIEDGKNGFLFETGNKKSLMEKLLILLTDSELHRKMSETCLMRYAEKFSTTTQIEKYLKVYQNLVDSQELKKK
jgi:glycosyltransferase involved in cell wall biosynthesis